MGVSPHRVGNRKIANCIALETQIVFLIRLLNNLHFIARFYRQIFYEVSLSFSPLVESVIVWFGYYNREELF